MLTLFLDDKTALGALTGLLKERVLELVRLAGEIDWAWLDECFAPSMPPMAGRSSVNITARGWVNADDFWQMKFDLSRVPGRRYSDF